jgi:hypothetical protein
MLYEARGLTRPPPTLVCVAAPQGRCLVPAGRGASMLPPNVFEYNFGRDRGASPAGLRMCDIVASLGLSSCAYGCDSFGACASWFS